MLDQSKDRFLNPQSINKLCQEGQIIPSDDQSDEDEEVLHNLDYLGKQWENPIIQIQRRTRIPLRKANQIRENS